MRSMKGLAVLGTAMVMWTGCGSAVDTARSDTAAVFAPLTIDEVVSSGSEERPPSAAAEGLAFEPAVESLRPLPPPPWSDTPLDSDAVPAPLLRAWAHAANRAQCAPLAPSALGAGEGARARTSELEGGWAVEFDRRGMPGLGADGEPCARCGRAVFGIAGTNLTAEDLAGEGDSVTPSFADGSQLLLEPPAEGEQVAAASLTVRGQDCVYQVWSFLGAEHVRELVSSLRLVSVEGPAPRVVAAR